MGLCENLFHVSNTVTQVLHVGQNIKKKIFQVTSVHYIQNRIENKIVQYHFETF